MYTRAKAPSVLAAKTSRLGPAQQITNLQNFDTNQRKEKDGGAWEMSSPRPVFNGKKHYFRTNSGGNNAAANGMSIGGSMTQEAYTQNHEENVRYISDAWQRVSSELDKSKKNGRDDGPEIYREKFQNNTLQGFEPVDLESWWGSRTMEKIKSSS